MSSSHTFLSPAEIDKLRREYQAIQRNIKDPPTFEEWVEIAAPKKQPRSQK